MKKLMILILITSSCISSAQRNRAPKMAPIFEDGYFVSLRGDTVRGKIQVNPDSELDFYRQFLFKTAGPSKPRAYTAQRAKAYGFAGRHFIMNVLESEKIFLERLVNGRLKLYEMKKPGKVNGYDEIVSVVFIRDSQAENADAALAEIRRIPEKFYKKALKPYFKEQPMIWSDLDKYNFDRMALANALKEYNSFYKFAGK